MGYVNDYLSYSRVDTYRKCPKAFEFGYVQGLRGDGTDATRFGSACHKALEETMLAIADDGGPVPEGMLLERFDRAFADEGLTDQELYVEGRAILRRYAAVHPPLAPMQVKGCEVPFDMKLGRFRVKGFIDRVDDLGDGTIEIIDYKTNRSPYSEDELATSMQLALYQWVARQMYPWAKRFVLSYWMLRMGYKQVTGRTDAQLEEQIAYFANLGERTESGRYPARVNALCGWCDHRERCEAFKAACSGGPVDLNGAEGLDALAARREALAGVAAYAKKAKDEVDADVKAVLDQRGDFVAGGKSFRWLVKTSWTYDTAKTLEILKSRTGMGDAELAAQVCSVDNTALKAFEKRLQDSDPGDKGDAVVNALKLREELEASGRSKTIRSILTGSAKGAK